MFVRDRAWLKRRNPGAELLSMHSFQPVELGRPAVSCKTGTVTVCWQYSESGNLTFGPVPQMLMCRVQSLQHGRIEQRYCSEVKVFVPAFT